MAYSDSKIDLLLYELAGVISFYQLHVRIDLRMHDWQSFTVYYVLGKNTLRNIVWCYLKEYLNTVEWHKTKAILTFTRTTLMYDMFK